MKIADINHLEVVVETQVEGGYSSYYPYYYSGTDAWANARADSLARGWNARASSWTETDTYTDSYTAASSSGSNSSASSGDYPYYY
ncbi:MAG: hypothetical protein WBB43_01810 [Limnoraphis sp.]